MLDLEVRTTLENETGAILQEEYIDGTADRIYVVNQESEIDKPYGMEATDHIVLENETALAGVPGNKIVQQNASGTGDITDIRMIASGSGYTSLPTATIDGTRFIGLEDSTSSETADFSRVELETGGRLVNESSFSVLNVTGATVIPFGEDIGRATSLNIIEHGIDFTSAPTLAFPRYAVLKTVSGTISADETFSSNVSGATGTAVSYTHLTLPTNREV